MQAADLWVLNDGPAGELVLDQTLQLVLLK